MENLKNNKNLLIGAGIGIMILIVIGIFINIPPSKPQTTTVTSVTSISTTSLSPVNLNGAGSTFIQPVIQAMASVYHDSVPTTTINYQGTGSGSGISSLENHLVDFAATDAPLQATDISKAPNALTIPMTIGAVTVAYHLPSIKSNLHLTGKVIADIFSGTITTWNDPEIANINANITLPSQSILVAHRSDGSGTTFVFTGYLSQESTLWNKTYGQAKSLAWPVGDGGNGNAGVAGIIQNTPYSIGYIELAYALLNNVTVAAIQNSAGNWVLPTLSSSAAAAASASNLPSGAGVWSTVNLLNEAGVATYPIVTFSYVLIYKDMSVNTNENLGQAQALVKFLWWAVHAGQGQSQGLSYVPLPQNVVAIDEATIRSITFGTTPLCSGC